MISHDEYNSDTVIKALNNRDMGNYYLNNKRYNLNISKILGTGILPQNAKMWICLRTGHLYGNRASLSIKTKVMIRLDQIVAL